MCFSDRQINFVPVRFILFMYIYFLIIGNFKLEKAKSKGKHIPKESSQQQAEEKPKLGGFKK